MTTVSHTHALPTTFPVANSELADDFVDDFLDDEIPDCLRARMIQNEDGEWVYQLTDEDRAAIEQSEQDIVAGRVHSHEDVMAETRVWLERNR